jgi:hypothetical protein
VRAQWVIMLVGGLASKRYFSSGIFSRPSRIQLNVKNLHIFYTQISTYFEIRRFFSLSHATFLLVAIFLSTAKYMRVGVINIEQATVTSMFVGVKIKLK